MFLCSFCFATLKVSAKENKNQSEAEPSYYETLETYQGLPCPYGGYYGYYYPGFASFYTLILYNMYSILLLDDHNLN